jgi:hypothetical protein
MTSPIAELYEAEEAAYRAAFRCAESHPSVRMLAAHASETLEALRKLARRRGVSLHAPGAVWRDTFLCLRDGMLDHLLSRPRDGAQVASGAAVFARLHHASECARELERVAEEEGDTLLVLWCHRWQSARAKLVAEVAPQLAGRVATEDAVPA